MSATMTDATLRAYQRWAPVYPPVAHNPLMRAEERAMLEHWPATSLRRALDLACGSGRYSQRLLAGGSCQVTAMDFCVPMLEQVRGVQRVCADMMQLPFAGASFDFVLSGLALGHARDVYGWADEIARVLAADGVLVYSDFHPEAVRAGHTRSFRDSSNISHSVPHRCHELGAQRAALARAGLQLEALQEIRVGVELNEPFEGSGEFYRRWHGLPVVLVVRARKGIAQALSG
jgi:SAM-dependent methyltransferase